MRPIRLRPHTKRLLILAPIALVGICLSSYLQVHAVYGKVQRPYAAELTPRQDKLLAQRNDMSKWLLGLAYGTLAALLGLQVKQESAYKPAESMTAMASCGLLVVSVFDGFLFQQATTDALTSDLDKLYGSYLDAPLQLQFYSLMVAVSLLAGWFLRPSEDMLKRLMPCCVAMLMPWGVGEARAQTNTAVACLQQWSASRHIEVSSDDQERLARLIDRVKTRSAATVDNQGLCEYSWALSDEIRGLVRFKYPQNPALGDKQFVDEMRRLDEQTSAPNFLPSDWVSRLVDLSKFWKAAPYAKLDIDSLPTGLTIRFPPQRPSASDATPYESRIPPGNYRVELSAQGHVVYSNSFYVSPGETKTIRYTEARSGTMVK